MTTKKQNLQLPDKKGYFGEYGGRYVPEKLIPILNDLTQQYDKYRNDKSFKAELKELLRDYVGRPSPLYFARNLSKKYGCKIYFKREDLNHTGAHKINNTLGQALLAKRMGKKKVIAETGAGQHGVATATAAALIGLDCEIFMGENDANKQKVNVERIKMLGAKINIIKNGQKALKEAVDSALEYYISHSEVFYMLGSVVGPHPYPMMVRDFQKIIGEECRKQIIKKEKKLPDYLVACVGGGSNAIGLFFDFIPDKNVKLVGVEPAGKGIKTGMHAATITLGKPGILHGFFSYLLQDNNGEPLPVYSIASGLDYPGVGPEQSFLKDSKRAEFATITDKEAISAFYETSKIEGIIPALETCHALAHAFKLAKKCKPNNIIVINFSGRGDKDVDFIAGLSKDLR
ncbi:MAG: tryptophan synthase subunit beta [Candidatus Woesearchaeota archaeon]